MPKRKLRRYAETIELFRQLPEDSQQRVLTQIVLDQVGMEPLPEEKPAGKGRSRRRRRKPDTDSAPPS